MNLRKTIVYIGNRQHESNMFEKASSLAEQHYNFLSLESGYLSINMLRKSQPFWYASIIVDLAKPGYDGMQLIKEIKSIRQLQHVPLIVYTDAVAADLNSMFESGADHFVPRPVQIETLVHTLNVLERSESLPFVLNTQHNRFAHSLVAV